MASIFTTLPSIVNKVAEKVAESAVNAGKKNNSGGSGDSRTNPGTSSPAGGYTEKYTGGNDALDAAIKEQSDRYFAAEKAGDAAGMREANDRANQLRNQYGYAAEFADKAINAVAQANRGGSGYSYSGGGGAQGVNDYSQYISYMNKARQEAARAQLKAAYDKNMAQLNRTAEQIPVEYQNARNQAAAQSDIQAQNFNEYAAARGLNTGAGGQAQLAFRNALQGNLSSLDQAEASSLADLELQRSQAETDYNNAIAQANAQGNYELAQQLYAEKVRVDEALREQMAWQAQQDFQKLQFDTANSQWQQQFDASQRASLADQGWNYLSIGQIPPQEVLDAMGIDANSAQNIASYYTGLARAKTTRRSRGGTTGGGNREADYNGLFQAAMESGYPKSYIANHYKDFGFKSSTGLYDEYEGWEPDKATTGDGTMDAYRNIYGGGASDLIQKAVDDLLYRRNFRGETDKQLVNSLAMISDQLGLNDEQAMDILRQLGIS